MKRAALLAGLLLGGAALAPGAAQVAPTPRDKAAPSAPQKADLSTPAAALRAFFAATNAGDLRAAAATVDGITPDADLQALQDEMKQRDNAQQTATLVKLTLAGTGDTRHGTATCRMEVRAGAHVMADSGAIPVSFRHTAEGWKLVPPDATTVQDDARARAARHQVAPRFLPQLLLVAYPRVLLASRAAARAANCQVNLKLIANAAKFEMIDTFAFPGADWQTTFLPHVKQKERYRCPVSGKPYAFNQRLQSVLLEKVQSQRKTVLFYEGEGEKLDFQHDGKAGVVTADFKTLLVTPEEAKTLRWAP